MVQIQVNGKTMDVEEGTTVKTLLEGLDIPQQGTAVELNCEIVPRSQHHLTTLKEGDRVEIVRMVGGG